MALYTDIASNFRSKNKDIAISEDEQAINNSIDNILRVRRGEVPGRPDFGSDLDRYLFEPMDALTEQLIEETIKESLAEFETRVEVVSIDFEDFPSQGVLRIILTYKMATDKNKEIRSYTVTLNRL